MGALVAYFSASGVTARIAHAIADAAGADIFEIQPVQPYSDADLNWRNPLARCNREKLGKKDVPVANKVTDIGQYDTLYVGFPVWYGCAPNVVNTFLKGYDLRGKKLYVFATSGGSGIGKTAEKLKPYVTGAEIVDARLLRSASEAKAWVKKE